MPIDSEFLGALKLASTHSSSSRTLPWPRPGAPDALVSFSSFDEWQTAIFELSLPEGIPRNMTDQYDRARKAYLVAWLDFDLVTLAEMAALAALEHCLKDCYLGEFREKHNSAIAAKAASHNRDPRLNENFRPEKVGLAALLKHMRDEDGLTDDQLPCVQKYGGQIMGLFDGNAPITLANMRNTRMHGSPFGSGYLSGLLELIRDLIVYAYRKRVEEARRMT